MARWRGRLRPARARSARHARAIPTRSSCRVTAFWRRKDGSAPIRRRTGPDQAMAARSRTSHQERHPMASMISIDTLDGTRQFSRLCRRAGGHAARRDRRDPGDFRREPGDPRQMRRLGGRWLSRGRARPVLAARAGRRTRSRRPEQFRQAIELMRQVRSGARGSRISRRRSAAARARRPAATRSARSAIASAAGWPS